LRSIPVLVVLAVLAGLHGWAYFVGTQPIQDALAVEELYRTLEEGFRAMPTHPSAAPPPTDSVRDRIDRLQALVPAQAVGPLEELRAAEMRYRRRHATASSSAGKVPTDAERNAWRAEVENHLLRLRQILHVDMHESLRAQQQRDRRVGWISLALVLACLLWMLLVIRADRNAVAKTVRDMLGRTKGQDAEPTPRFSLPAEEERPASSDDWRQRLERILDEHHVLRQMLDRGPSPMMIVTAAKQVVYANQAALDLLHCPEQSKCLHSSCTSFCRQGHAVCPVSQLQDGESTSFECMARSEDHQEVPVLKSVTRLRLGRDEYYLEVFLDIRRIKESQQALVLAREEAERVNRELARKTRSLDDARIATLNIVNDLQFRERQLLQSEERYRRFVDGTDNVVLELDAERKIIYGNPAVRGVLGLDPCEVIGRSLEEFVRPEEALTIRRLVSRWISHAAPTATLECSVLDRDQREHHMLWNFLFQYDSIDEPTSIQVLGRDITEIKEVENQLRRAKESAEAADRAKSDFLANMSHEIRTPLNGILGAADLLQSGELDAEQRDLLRTMNLCAQSLLGVINDVLDLSKIEARKLELEYIPFDLREELESVLEIHADRARDKHVELACRLPSCMCTAVQGDPTRLTQIFNNLLSNALKFTDVGEVILSAEVREQDAAGQTVRFAVRDTGIGIAPETRARLFRPFSQKDSSTTRQYGGSGLGLVICKQIVEIMGGEIGVQSEPDEGSEFWFTVRLDKQTPAPPPPARPLDGRTVVLTVEHDAGREILQDYLTALGADVRTCATAGETLRALEHAARAGTPFPYAVVDMTAETIDGLALASSIQDSPRLAATTPILLVDRRQGRSSSLAEAGFALTIRKPIRLNEMRRLFQPDEPDSDAPPTPSPTSAPLRVLVAEDNLVNQNLMRKLLERAGHVVEVVDSGLKVLEIDWRAFDVILMDVQMPGKSGLETAREIRAAEVDDGSPPIPMIAMTAHALKGDRERCLEAGMNDYVAKPIRTEDLFEALRTHVPAHAAPTHPPREESPPPRVIPPCLPAPNDGASSGGPAMTIVDLNDAVENLGGLWDLLVRTMEIFLEDVPAQLDEIAAGLKDCDSDAVAEAAHSLKGAVANFSADRTYQAALRLEQAARAGDLADSQKAHVELRAALEELLPLLQEAIQTNQPIRKT
jgi:PAS domain S-box-containing protein